MDLATAPCVQKVLQDRLLHPVWGYSRWNHDDFKLAIADWFRHRFDTPVDRSSIVYGPSVIYIVARFLHLWSQAGDEVLVHTPAYDAFDKVIEHNGRTMLRCPLVKNNERYEVDWPLFTRMAHRSHCKILLLCSPQNPTGRVWTKPELIKMDEICRAAGVRVISDEIHMDTSFSKHQPWAGITAADDWVLVNSASKSFNIPALGGAYALIGNETSRNAYLDYLKAADGLSSPAIPGMLALMTAYKEGEPWLEALNRYLRENQLHFACRLNNAFPTLNHQPPEGTYLSWVDLNPLGLDMNKLQERLVNHEKIAIMRGDTYGPEGNGFIRMNLGCSREKLDEGIDRLVRAINALR